MDSFELKLAGKNHHCFLMENCLVAASFLQAERIQIVVVAVEKTFGVADLGLTTPQIVVEGVSDLIAAVMAVAVVECFSEAAIVVVAVVAALV